MSGERDSAQPRWADAVRAAALFAVDPFGLGGVALRARAGPARERWLTAFRDLLPPSVPWRRMPLHVAEGRLLGGLDLAATLRQGRPIAERGLLAEADNGVVVVAMTERLPAATAAHLAAVLDSGEVVVERDGLALRLPARIGVVALDEGIADDERPPAALLDRLSLHLDLDMIGDPDARAAAATLAEDDVAAARALLPAVRAGDGMVAALCEAAWALGIASLRAPLLALRVAKASAALAGLDAVAEADAALAARLVLAPRATRAPAGDPGVDPKPDDAARDGSASEPAAGEDPVESAVSDRPLGDVVLAAAQSAIPAGLLTQLRGTAGRVRSSLAGRAGALQRSPRRGRPAGARAGDPRNGSRLDLVETLRAAAPWQRLRRRADRPATRVAVRRDDFRITRLKQRSETVTIFVVDASGSAALHRLAEAKGAVELLLAECYVRRDQVALVAFRGAGAEILLPPTRSLVRAKRCLAHLPGGGGTPLAAGIDAAAGLVDTVRRRGQTPVVVLLTDGRANIARDGTAGRARAEADALAAARRLQATAMRVVLVDTSPQAHPSAERLAAAMDALYLPLPYAGAAGIARSVQAATAGPQHRAS